MSLGSGSRLDAYEIVRPLGAGGMGEVWLATEVRLGRKVALKILPPDLTRDHIRVQRFEQEARAASALNHPNVCHIYALGETGDGQHYIAMEYVEGDTLRQRLSTTRLTVREALDIGIQVSAALSAAHAAGIVHRDIKPENVMLRPDGFVKVLDFGLAKPAPATLETAGGDRTHTVLKTEAGTVVGTAAYMSPEQTRGQDVDARTDIWSLGVLLYEMVAGRSPFAARNNSDMLVAILDREPDLLARFDPNVPHELQRIVTKTLRKDRALRYQTTRDLLLDLETLRTEITAHPRGSGAERGLPSLAEPAFVPTRHSSSPAKRVWIGRHRFLFAVTAALASGAVVGLVWFTMFRHPTIAPRVSLREPVLTRLTANPTELAVTSAQISPDGRYLAYADPSGLRIRLLETGETQSIPNTHGMNVHAWSRDATMVRASTCENGTCVAWDISLLGGARRRSGTTWSEEEIVIASPDGSRLLRITKKGVVKIDYLNGTPPRPLQLGAGVGFVRAAAWSADLSRVLYVTEDGSAIQSVAVDGGSPVAVFSAAKGEELLDVAELATHTLLAVTLRRGTTLGLAPQMCLNELRTTDAGVATGELRRLTDWGDEMPEQLSASALGNRVAFLSTLVQADVYVADLDSHAALSGVPRRLTQDDRDDMPSAWLPDNASVVFSSTRNGTVDIFTQRIDSDIAEPLVVAPGDQMYPQVTSDGQWVMYQEYREPTRARIMRVPVAGGTPELLFTSPPASSRCSSRGGCIHVEFQASNSILSRLDPIRGKGSELARTPADVAAAQLLPTGDAFAFVPNEEMGPQNRVHVISFTGAPAHDIVVRGVVNLHSLDWLSTGLGFFSVEGPVPIEAPQLLTRQVTSKRNHVLFITPNGQSRVVWSPTVVTPQWAIPSRDGKHLAVLATSTQRNGWMLTNF